MKKIICVDRTAVVKDFLGAASYAELSGQLCVYCQCAGGKQSAAPAGGLTALRGLFMSDIPHTCPLWRKWFKAALLTWRNRNSQKPWTSSSSSGGVSREISLQLCSPPAVKRILRKHFRCSKNKM